MSRYAYPSGLQGYPQHIDDLLEVMRQTDVSSESLLLARLGSVVDEVTEATFMICPAWVGIAENPTVLEDGDEFLDEQIIRGVEPPFALEGDQLCRVRRPIWEPSWPPCTDGPGIPV